MSKHIRRLSLFGSDGPANAAYPGDGCYPYYVAVCDCAGPGGCSHFICTTQFFKLPT